MHGHKAWKNRRLSPEQLTARCAPFVHKLLWFEDHGYEPHYYQLLFHTAQHEDYIQRFRHLVAGRRGGKTLSASWEIVYYCLHPEEFHRMYHGKESSTPLWTWQLTKDYQSGRPSLWTVLQVIGEAGLVRGANYEYNKTDKIIEFTNGSILEFKTAVDPQSLRGAGLDILWMDEAGFIPDEEAYQVTRPAIADKRGMVITTTTPWGKNWFFEEFFEKEVTINDPDQFQVEYWSLHNPYFPREEWLRLKRELHPMLFAREFMAAFDAFDGIDLSGEWLQYYTAADIMKLKMKKYIGIDPAVSLSDDADYFALAVLGITEDNDQAFILETFMGRIPFPEQVELIKKKWIKHRPQMIGIERQAYQLALAQQVERLPGLPPVVPVEAKGKKFERILSMSPLFKTGRIKIHKLMTDFIDQWVSFDSEKKNQKDDVLDAVEIAIRTAGVLTPATEEPSGLEFFDRPTTTLEELAERDIRKHRPQEYVWDDEDMLY